MNEQPKYSVGIPFDISLLTEGKNLCSFSIKMWKEKESVKGNNFPFITSSGRINFFSQMIGNFNISSLYAYASIFSPFNVFYTLRNCISCYFIPYDDDLEKLRMWKETLDGIKGLNEKKTCNFKSPLLQKKTEKNTMFTLLF